MRHTLLWLVGLVALLASLAAGDVASADRGRGHDDDDDRRGRPARIVWEQPRVEISLNPGESRAMTVQFTATRDIPHATLSVRPGHAPLTAAPHDLGAVRAGQSYTVTITAHLPGDEERPHRRAQLFVQDGQRRLGPPLRIDIRNARAGEEDEDEEGRDAHLRWTPPVVLAMVQPGSTFTTTVSFVSDRDLRSAQVQVRARDGLSVTASSTNLGHVAANQPVTLTLTAQAPADTDHAFFVASVRVVQDAQQQLRPALLLVLGVAPPVRPARDRTLPTITAIQASHSPVTLTAIANAGGSGVARTRFRTICDALAGCAA